MWKQLQTSHGRHIDLRITLKSIFDCGKKCIYRRFELTGCFKYLKAGAGFCPSAEIKARHMLVNMQILWMVWHHFSRLLGPIVDFVEISVGASKARWG